MIVTRRICVERGTMDVADRIVPSWNVVIRSAEKKSTMTTTSNFVVKSFAVMDPDIITSRREIANEYAEALYEILGWDDVDKLNLAE